MIPEGAAARQTNFERRETGLTMVFTPPVKDQFIANKNSPSFMTIWERDCVLPFLYISPLYFKKN